MSREVEDTDTFHFNEQFSSKLYKLKIGTITAQKESEPEKLETRQKVRPAQHHGHSFFSFLQFCQPLYCWKSGGAKGASARRQTTGWQSLHAGAAMHRAMDVAQTASMQVEEDRKPLVEAAIVRIMKARRVLDHNSIISEVTRQLSARFSPTPAVIKKRIESLIDREFLERDPNDRRLYKYMA